MQISDLQRVKETHPIRDHFPGKLHRYGDRQKGLCPFHDEKTPSFTIYPDGNAKCFGCGWYGDIITFVQDLYSIDFTSALRQLGVDMPTSLKRSQKPKEDAVLRECIRLHLLKDPEHYHKLREHQNVLIRVYAREELLNDLKPPASMHPLHDFNIMLRVNSGHLKDQIIYKHFKKWMEQSMP